MHGTFDAKADAAYLSVTKSVIVQTKQITDDVLFDIDADNKLVGIEFLSAKSQLAEETLRSFTQL